MHLKIGKINLFIDTANATFRTLCIQSFATCFGRFGHHRADFTTCTKKIPRRWPPMQIQKMEKRYPNQHRTNALNQ